MSNVEVAKLEPAAKSQLVLSYAALVLGSSDVQITEENLRKVVEASGNKTDEKLLKAFAQILHGKDVKKFFTCGGSGGGSTETKAEVVEKKPEAKKEGSYFF